MSLIAAATAVILLGGGAQPVPEQAATWLQRPVWVLRSPLDDLDDAVTIALRPGIFAAYDVGTCGLHQCWSGGISLSGTDPATFPRAVSQVSALYGEAVQGPVWRATKGGESISVETDYAGYEASNGRVTLLYDLSAPGWTARMRETPYLLSQKEADNLWAAWSRSDVDAPFSTDDVFILKREFEVSGLPAGVQLEFRWDRVVATISAFEGFGGRSLERTPDGHSYVTHDPDLEPSLLTLEFSKGSVLQFLTME